MLPIYISMIDEPAKRSLFEQVYLRYRKQMFYLARTLLEDTAAAEDAVHDVFLRIASHHMPTLQKLTDPDDIKNFEKMLDIMEDNEDIQNVWHNWDEE